MISPQIKLILDGLRTNRNKSIYEEDGTPLININKLTGQVSTFYEKLRYIVDYKEEHTIRRSAIERILKRKILIERSPDIGLSLLEELVASGYLTNKSLPESVAINTNNIISKYQHLGVMSTVPEGRIISLMASEVERFLFPQVLNDLMVQSFYSTVFQSIVYRGELSQSELYNQIYLGCRRSLLEDDYDASFYALTVRYLPELLYADTEERVEDIAPAFLQTINKVGEDLENNLGWQISSKLKNQSVYFSVIREIFREYEAMSEKVFSSPEKVSEEIQILLSNKYYEQFTIAQKSGMRAVIYILLTKIIFAFAFEFPYEKFVLGHINYLALGTNVVFHPLLLLTMVKSIPMVPHDNTVRIVEGVMDILENKKLKPIYINPKVSNPLLQTIFDFLYIALFTISFGFILWALIALEFNIVSILLFLLFLTLVSFFGFRIRHNAKKWRLVTESENFIDLLWSFFTIPIVRTGRWLSKRFSTVNVFVFILDFIIETPFKFILGTFNSFISFLKEKRQDPY